MNVVAPPSIISSGVDVEEQSFTWVIENFPILRKHKHLIESQKFPFTAGETKGRPSKWTVYLTEKKKDEKRWIRIFLELESPEPTDGAFKASYSEFRCIVKNKEGDIVKDLELPPKHIATEFDIFSYGFHGFIDADDANLRTEESLVIHITFKLYTPASAKLTSSLEAIKEKFQARFLDQLQKDFSRLLETPDPSTDIKVISNDKKEFSMQKGILAARSKVFAAMLRADMIEANSGVIKLSDISSKTMEVFLNFLKTGVLLPDWSEAGVILELTNAAAEYQLPDLLLFLDATMGKVCRLENVLALAILARRLSLKVGEEELMMFAKNEGVGSLDNLIQMCNAELPENDSEPPAAANKGRKRKNKEC